MKASALVIWLVIVCTGCNNSVWAASLGDVKHYQSQERYQFGAQLLKLALSKSQSNFNIVAINYQGINEARGEHMVIKGQLDVQWLSTTTSREESLIAIKIPLYRGMLGLRLLLARYNRATELSNVRSLSDLQHYTGGHGSHWGDLPIYSENALPVKTHVDYELLFKWVIDRRIDYFHRGMNEIWSEQARYKHDLVVVDNVMLFYPHLIYFFVTKKRPILAQKIQKGLLKALEDGSYKKLFFEAHQEILLRSNLKDRKLIKLRNPASPDFDYSIAQWWLPQY